MATFVGISVMSGLMVSLFMVLMSLQTATTSQVSRGTLTTTVCKLLTAFQKMALPTKTALL
jgi:hypothetical protein